MRMAAVVALSARSSHPSRTAVLDSLDGVGHVWPDGDPLDATGPTLAFFARHRL